MADAIPRRLRVRRRGEPAAITVEVIDKQRSIRVGGRWLATIVRRALARQGIATAEVCVLLLDDRAMAKLHGTWMGLAEPTDVITFDMADSCLPGLRGDLAVSAETARRTARELGWQPRHELAYYVVHGLLHLVGYDDHDPADRRSMRARERALMRAIGLPTPPAGGRRVR